MFFFSKKEKKALLYMAVSSEFKMIIMESRYCVMSKYFGAEDMRVKYNIDYLTKCSIIKRALVKCCFAKILMTLKFIPLVTFTTSCSHIPPPSNHQIEASGQQSSQNCTTPTCRIMQRVELYMYMQS